MISVPSLTAWAFAAAGLLCATGPILIHLLNRRRYKTVRWAAMDFLREALTRSRRVMEMRDIALLVLRTLAVLLFGLALARPFVAAGSVLLWAIVLPTVILGLLLLIVAVAAWSAAVFRWLNLLGAIALFGVAGFVLSMQIGVTESADQQFDGSQPLHAVLLIDNSMSMGYQSLDGNLLDVAKTRAKQFIERLPEASPVSIVPTCGSTMGISADPYTKADALDVLDKLTVVDRSATLQEIVALAKQASLAEPHLAKRIVLFGDQQRANWDGLTLPEQFADFPEMQIVEVSTDDVENSWISDLRIEDGLADVETPTTLIVELRHDGRDPRQDIRLALSVDDIEVASKTVTLEPGEGAKEIRFEHLFNTMHVEPGQPKFVPVKATITEDYLPADDARNLVAHVVASLPVVFVDQYGEEGESVDENKVGETMTLRKWLAPTTVRGDQSRQLVQIRHRRIQQLDRDLLADARLVVIAGVNDPGTSLPLLREYVEQGGQLVIAAGADFNPDFWNRADELDGARVLPAPLEALPVGELPESATGQLTPVMLSYESMESHYYFRLADTAEDDLRELYSLPFFFRYVEVDASSEAIEEMKQAEVDRLTKQLATGGTRESNGGNGQAPALDAATAAGTPSNWLLWDNGSPPVMPSQLPDDANAQAALIDELAERSLPRVLARFENERQSPYLVERQIGRGNVLFVASGFRSSWNTLRTTDAMLMFDRILRSMIQSTLPARNFSTEEHIALPLKTTDREVELALYRPGDASEPEVIDTGFIGKEVRGYHVANSAMNGLYRVEELDAAESSSGENTVLHATPLAVNCDPEESSLTPLTRDEFEQRTAGSPLRWVGPSDEISLQGAQSRGQDFYWMMLIIAVTLFLLAELGILAWPNIAIRTTANESSQA